MTRSGYVPSYHPAGTITTGYDGGNHPITGDVLACRTCGALILPADQATHDTYHTATGTHRRTE